MIYQTCEYNVHGGEVATDLTGIFAIQSFHINYVLTSMNDECVKDTFFSSP